MGFSQPYDRFLDLPKQALPRAGDTADKRGTKRKEQTQAFAEEGTTCGISSIPFTHKGGTRKLVCSEASPVRKSYVRT